MWKHLFLCSFDAIKRLFNCALFTDGVHAICHKMKISFEILPQTDICDIDRHARKKVTGKREKIFSPNLANNDQTKNIVKEEIFHLTQKIGTISGKCKLFEKYQIF